MANWDGVVDIIHTDFWDGRILAEFFWNMIVLFPEGNRELLGIGLIEVICKMVLGVVNCWIEAAVNFHDVLHGL